MTTRVFVDPETSSGRMAVEAVDHILQGRATLARLGEILYQPVDDVSFVIRRDRR